METVKLYIHTLEDGYVVTKAKRSGVKGTKLIGTADGILRALGYLPIEIKPSNHDYVSDGKGFVYQLSNVEYNE